MCSCSRAIFGHSRLQTAMVLTSFSGLFVYIQRSRLQGCHVHRPLPVILLVILFCVGICMGVMTAYSSCRDKEEDVIADNFIINLCDTIISFGSGFVVFATVGYSPTSRKRSLRVLCQWARPRFHCLSSSLVAPPGIQLLLLHILSDSLSSGN